MRFIKKLFFTVIVLIIIAVGLVGGAGYKKYKKATEALPIDLAARQIAFSENYTELENISQTFVDAMISVEDRRFYKHRGIDPIGIVRAIKINFDEKEAVQGGSSITQQLAKNMYFMEDNTFTRKIAESITAIEIEKRFTKEEILELYFNTIYYGSGYYSIYDATMGYFGKKPHEITDYESTLLAGIPNAPSVYSLDNDPELARQRQKTVVLAMVKNRKLTQADAEEILNQ